MEPMEIEFMWKDWSSGAGACPALYRAPGGYVVQGKTLTPETRKMLRQLGGDEDAIFIPANVLDRLKDLP
jgi:hypothetical protein